MTAPLPRAADYAATMLTELEAKLGQRVDRREGSRWDALVGVFAAGFVRAQQITAQQFDQHVLDRATGDALDAYCTARGPVRRFPAIAAKGPLTLTRASTSAGQGTIAAGTTVRVPTNGASVVFQVVADTNVRSTDLTVSPTVIAQTAGAASNVGTVSAGLALTSTIFDATLLPTSISVAGGSDAETDAEMRQRQRLWEQGRQRATRAAIAFGALLVNGVKRVVVASFDDPHLGSRGMVYVGDINWQSTDVMLSDVAASLESWRPFGPSLPIGGFASSAVQIVGTARMARSIANYSIAALQAAAAARALDYFNARADAYSYDLSMLAGRIARANDDIASVSLSSPASSVPSPLTAAALVLTGFPASLTRYSLSASDVNIAFVGT